MAKGLQRYRVQIKPKPPIIFFKYATTRYIGKGVLR